MMSKQGRTSSIPGKNAEEDQESDSQSISGGVTESLRKRRKQDPGEVLQALYDILRNSKKADGTLLCDSFIHAPKRRQEPGYYDVVANPIDMLRIQQKLRTDEYEDVDELQTDVELLVENAKSFYKKSSPEYNDANELWELFLQTKAKFYESAEDSPLDAKGKLTPKGGKTDAAELQKVMQDKVQEMLDFHPLALDLANPFRTRASSVPAETENVHPVMDRLPPPDENGIVNGLVLSGHHLLQDHVEDILIHLDPDTLKMARFVCKSWRQMIENWVFKKKAVQEAVYSFSKCSEIEKTELSLPWWMYYTICKFDPFNRNLVKNNCGQNQQEHWTVIKGGFGQQDYGWGVENPPVGWDPVPNHPDFEGHTSCFVTSYTKCKKEQQIKLSDVGLSSKIMDVYQPKIFVSEWYAGRFDSSCIYKLKGILINEEGEKTKKISHIAAPPRRGKKWRKVRLALKYYGPSARFVKLNHSGQDVQIRSGHYGSKMSGASVKVCLPLKPAISFSEDNSPSDDDPSEIFSDEDPSESFYDLDASESFPDEDFSPCPNDSDEEEPFLGFPA